MYSPKVAEVAKAKSVKGTVDSGIAAFKKIQDDTTAEEKKVKEAQREKQAEQQRLEAISREAAQKAARDARYAARKQRIR